MPEIASSTVAEIIILARELPRAENEFDSFIESLNESEQSALVAMMWIGRGAFEPEDWDEAVRTAGEERHTPTASYLKGSPHLADHLESGLEALGISARDEEDQLYRWGET
ncbi:DUF3775 domain-containing protein [Pseudoroseicyclus sp. CXY001]|uniref:DUF3775 domain-containing protein n=1 Tax=Pseudoroseicyclus sp. CXY001 TaxID=3242492 RepID=UPI003570D820